MNQSEHLRTQPIGKLLLEFSIPAIVGMVVNATYNVVDRMYVGWMGPLAMTGIGLNMPFMTMLMAFGMLVGIGGAANISIRLGQGKVQEAEKILGNAITALIVIMLLVMVVGLTFKIPLLYLFGASSATIGYADDYITVILLGSVVNGLGFGVNNLIRAEGSPKIAMYTMFLGAIMNVILAPILIFWAGMGIKGAGLATVISQCATAIWVMSHFMRGGSKLKLKAENLIPDFKLLKSVFAIGVSPFSMQVAASVVTIVSNNALKTNGGDIAIGAMTVINAISIFFMMPIFGLNQGTQPVIGFNYGAKAYDRVKEALKKAAITATCIASVGFIMTQLFTVPLIRIFNSDADLIHTASFGMKIFLCMLPLVGFQVISANYFQSVGKAPKAMFLSLLRQVIILIPMLLILPHFFGLTGVWLAGPIADFTASLMTAVFLYQEMVHLTDAHEQIS